MNIKVEDIIDYFKLLEKEYGFHISLHTKNCCSFFSENAAQIGKFSTHHQKYCSVIKSKLHRRCLMQQRLIHNNESNEIFLGMAHCGLWEFVIPLYCNEIKLGFICVGGFCNDYNQSISRIEKYKLIINKSELLSYVNQQSKSVPDISKIKTLFKFPAEALSMLMYEHYDERNTSVNTYSEIVSYIALNYTSKICVDDIAKFCLCSASHINHTFKKISGKSISRYTNELRIKKAKSLLKNTDLSISEIAAEVGFSETNYFTNTFKKYENISPSQYRKYKTGTNHLHRF